MKKIILHLLLFCFYGTSSFGQAGFTKVVDPSNPATTFITQGVYKGCTWIDMDNDHDPDLFSSPNYLFRNDGNGTFVQLLNPFGFTPLQNPGGSSWADLNQDGFADCIIAQKPSGVFLNNGNGTFTNSSSQVQNLDSFPAWGCAIGDWNQDAYPDFIFAHAANFHTPGPFPSKLYLNTNGTVNPQYITGYTLTDSVKPYTVPYWSDYDLDGDMDLFVASGPGGSAGPDFCYKNLKVETGLDSLERMTTELFATQLQDGQCYNFIDFDNDNDLDLCLTNYAGAPTRFYMNATGTYTSVTTPFTLTANNLTNNWGDFDNDGDLDVIISNDTQPNKFYRNNGNGTFALAVNFGIQGGCGITNGDYDNDGDLDLFVQGNGGARSLFRNDSVGTGNNWINIHCKGITSNSSAIGTRVWLKATIQGVSFWQTREISAQNSFQSQNDLRVHFGLGNALIADSVIIQYSGGQLTHLTGISANKFYCHEEGNGMLCLVNGILTTQKTLSFFTVYPSPADSFLQVRLTHDPAGKYSWELFDTTAKLLNSGQEESGNFMLQTGHLTAGTYFIKITCKNQTGTLAFVKE